jgi:hypothetical protein
MNLCRWLNSFTQDADFPSNLTALAQQLESVSLLLLARK